jgi:hypothetical protein
MPNPDYDQLARMFNALPEPLDMQIVNNSHGLTLGTDVELGIYHMNTSQYIPATSFNTPGQKGQYEDLLDSTETLVGTYHRDNITVEFQTLPAESQQDFASSVTKPFGALNRHYSDFIGADLEAAPVIHFDDPDMLLVPEALEMGCEPDMCAYTLKEMKGPKASAMGAWRVCSGHLHFGHAKLKAASLEEKALFVRLLDRIVGPGSGADVFQHTWRRRFFYGQAGRFRIKPYGLEYRTPDNSWTTHRSKAIWRRCVNAFNIWMAGGAQDVIDRIEKYTDMDDDAVRTMLDNPLGLTIEDAAGAAREWQIEHTYTNTLEDTWTAFDGHANQAIEDYYREDAE